MPVVVVCPECGATTTPDADTAKGGTVSCRQCGKPVPVPEPKPAVPPPLPPKSAAATVAAASVTGGPAANDEIQFEVIDDGDDRAAAGRRDREDELDDTGRPFVGRRRRDDDEDDRPRSRRHEDDDEDDRARRRSRDDYEDDDRPARSLDRPDEDDDEENRPRGRGRDEEEDDEDDDRRRPAGRDRDDDDEVDDRPRRRDREEDDEGEEPRSRTAGRDDDEEDNDGQVVRSRRPDDDDGEDRRDDRPKSKVGLLVGVLLLLLLVGAGGAAAGWYFFIREPDSNTTVASNTNPPDDNAGGNPGGQGPVGPKGDGPGTKGPIGKGPIGKGLDVWKHPPRELAIQPVRFSGERKSITLPGQVSEVCSGGDGKYLFLHCPEERKLLVFDVTSVEIVKEFPTGGKDARFAAGATKLLLYDGIVQLLQRIDLVTLEMDKQVPLPFPGTFREISIGSGSRGPALVLTDSPVGAWPVHFLDIDALAAADVGWTAAPPTDLPRDLRFRASASGNRWIGMPDGKDAKGAVLVARDGKALSVTRIAQDKALGFATLSPDGENVYCRLGMFRIRNGPSVDAPPPTDTYSVPSVAGSFDVRVQPSDTADTVQVTLRQLGTNLSPKTINAAQPFRSDEAANPEQLVNYIADAHALVVVQPTQKRLEVVKLDLFDPAAKSASVTSTAPDRFTPGKPFQYPIRILTNASQVSHVVSGPTGVSMTPDAVVRWNPANNEARDEVSIRVTVTGDNVQGMQTVRLFNTAAQSPKPPEQKKGPEPKKGPTSPDPAVPVFAAGVKLAQPAAETVSIPPAEIAGGHVEIALPGQARNVCVGGGGRYLIFHVPTARKLVVFDTGTLKSVRSLPLTTDDILFAAGMEKLLVVYPAEKTIVRYNLATLKPENDAAMETRQQPTFIAMGSATAGPLILGGIPSQNNASKMALTFLDIESFKEVKIDKTEGSFQVTTAAPAHLRVSADGSTLGLWRAKHTPSGVQVARLTGNTIKGAYSNEPAGEVTPSPDGQRIYTEQGAYSLDAKQEGPRSSMVPALAGTGFVSLSLPATGKRSVAVWGPATDKPLATFGDLPGFNGQSDPFERGNPNLTLDQRLFWVPSAGVLIVVPPTADKLHVYQVKK
jgi:hypothetical protein